MVTSWTIYLVLLTLIYTLCSAGERKNNCTNCCSGMNSYVILFQNKKPKFTLTSSHVSYGPYRYLLSQTEVRVFSLNENICNLSTINDKAKYNGKIVLIRLLKNKYKCDVQKWSLNLQLMNSSGVLLWNQNQVDTTNVYVEVGSGSHKMPIIPTRMISFSDGYIMYSSIVLNKKSFQVSFQCDKTPSYPLIICVEDVGYGSSWLIDGNYQKQALLTFNDHPVWVKKETDLTYKRFIWLHVSHKNNWLWVIGRKIGSISQSKTVNKNTSRLHAQAYCNITKHFLSKNNITNPSECTKWYSYLIDRLDNNRHKGWSFWNNTIQTQSNTCKTSKNNFCFSSENNDLNPVKGSYRQLHNKVGLFLKTEEVNNSKKLRNKAYMEWTRVQYGKNRYYWGWIIFSLPLSQSRFYAFCPYLVGKFGWKASKSTLGLSLKPNLCRNWYKYQKKNSDGSIRIISDKTVDVDEKTCEGRINRVSHNITFPKLLCFKSKKKYHFHQQYFGLWYKISSTYQNVAVYQFSNTSIHLIFNDIADTWIIVRNIPNKNVSKIYSNELIAECHDSNHPETPMHCSKGWLFGYYPYSDINFTNWDKKTEKCFDDKEVITKPINSPKSICLHFSHFPADAQGLYKKINQNNHLLKRPIYKLEAGENVYYILYNSKTRRWISKSKNKKTRYELICFEYDQLNPLNCKRWYVKTNVGLIFRTNNVRIEYCLEHFCVNHIRNEFGRLNIIYGHYTIVSNGYSPRTQYAMYRNDRLNNSKYEVSVVHTNEWHFEHEKNGKKFSWLHCDTKNSTVDVKTPFDCSTGNWVNENITFSGINLSSDMKCFKEPQFTKLQKQCSSVIEWENGNSKLKSNGKGTALFIKMSTLINARPFYMHSINGCVSKPGKGIYCEIYIYFEYFRRNWVLSQEINTMFPLVYCSEFDKYCPENCVNWFDISHNKLNVKISQTPLPTTNPSTSPTTNFPTKSSLKAPTIKSRTKFPTTKTTKYDVIYLDSILKSTKDKESIFNKRLETKFTNLPITLPIMIGIVSCITCLLILSVAVCCWYKLSKGKGMIRLEYGENEIDDIVTNEKPKGDTIAKGKQGKLEFATFNEEIKEHNTLIGNDANNATDTEESENGEKSIKNSNQKNEIEGTK